MQKDGLELVKEIVEILILWSITFTFVRIDKYLRLYSVIE